MTTHFFTFGVGHICSCGRSLANHYTTLEAEDSDAARDRMFSVWGRRWAAEYESEEEMKGLSRLESNFDDPSRCPCGNMGSAELSRLRAAAAWLQSRPKLIEDLADVCARRMSPTGKPCDEDRVRALRVITDTLEGVGRSPM